MIRIPLHTLTEGLCCVPEASAHYLVHVLRQKVGASFEVFNPSTGEFATATLESIHERNTIVRIGPIQHAKPSRNVVWVQGYPKGDKFSDIVRDATELGATTIIPALCERSIAQLSEQKWRERQQRWQTIAEQAARQCQRKHAPSMMTPMPWAEALTYVRPQVRYAFVLWEQATQLIGSELIQCGQPGAYDSIAFCVGPEGGLSLREIEQAQTLQFSIRSLGNTILRTETVAAAVLGTWQILSTQKD